MYRPLLCGSATERALRAYFVSVGYYVAVPLGFFLGLWMKVDGGGDPMNWRISVGTLRRSAPKKTRWVSEQQQTQASSDRRRFNRQTKRAA